MKKQLLLMLCLLSTALLHAKQPNVLFISIDDLNDYVSILGGHPQAKTPHLERLVKMGISFNNAQAPSSACNPSRCSVMTGRQPFVTGVYQNGQNQKSTIKKYGTLSKEFLDNGYFTAGSGKILHTFYYPEGHWTESKNKFPWPKMPKENRIEIGGEFDAAGFFDNAVEDQTGDYLSVDWVSERLKQPHSEPFFLACGIYRPHVVWQVPKKYYDLFPLESIQLPEVKEDDLDDVPEIARIWAHSKEGGEKALSPHPHQNIVEAGHWKRGVQAYLACIAYADAMLGRLLDALEECPEKDNTIVVMWSDHGWHLGEKEHWRKATLWEEVARVPFIIVAPGITKPGSTCDKVVGLIDIYPTLRDLCGLDGKTKLCGNSLRPLLNNPLSNWTHPTFTTYIGASISLRTEDYRYTRYKDGSEELYDHRVDPNEWTNLATDAGHKGELAKLRAMLPQKMEKPVAVTGNDDA